MFSKPSERTDMIFVQVEGRCVAVPPNASAAAAALIAGLQWTRTSPASGDKRAPYCMMGVCFECLLEIDGEPSQQGCMVRVRPGMSIRRQEGARQL
jgi:D-hydroxyproline dehydrogenase subunit gamma